ncbi:MAG: terpene cyclase/mutase family protein [Planctomycetota bacterium]|jgi:squalene cyclase|nr:terpene cyclase/mutase family protein [Planctomycetota bacterium]
MLHILLPVLVIAAPISSEESQVSAVFRNSKKLDARIGNGLAYLASHQSRDGSWGGGAYARNVGITGLCVMAFLSNGDLPGEGKYSNQVSLGLGYLIRSTRRDGYITNEGANMYAHGFAALSLAEAYGVSPKFPALGEKLRDAIGLIVRTQKPDGGWRYTPNRLNVSDLSVTVCQLQALRAARNVGIKVPKQTINRAVDYISKCANPNGTFRYMPEQRGFSLAMTCAAVTALYVTGDYHSEILVNGIEYLLNYAGRGIRRHNYFYYAHYYGAQAMFQAGGKYWKAWYPKIRDDLVRRQRGDGSWKGDEVGPAFGTAMALIVLQIPKQYLPIFQR